MQWISGHVVAGCSRKVAETSAVQSCLVLDIRFADELVELAWDL